MRKHDGRGQCALTSATGARPLLSANVWRQATTASWASLIAEAPHTARSLSTSIDAMFPALRHAGATPPAPYPATAVARQGAAQMLVCVAVPTLHGSSRLGMNVHTGCGVARVSCPLARRYISMLRWRVATTRALEQEGLLPMLRWKWNRRFSDLDRRRKKG